MKRIKLLALEKITSSEVLTIVASQAPEGVKVQEMRQRCRVLDALEGAEGTLDLEDADYDLLKGLVQKFKFAAANRDLLKIVDEVLEAETLPKPAKLTPVADAAE